MLRRMLIGKNVEVTLGTEELWHVANCLSISLVLLLLVTWTLTKYQPLQNPTKTGD
jgi:hypothetical protein